MDELPPCLGSEAWIMCDGCQKWIESTERPFVRYWRAENCMKWTVYCTEACYKAIGRGTPLDDSPSRASIGIVCNHCGILSDVGYKKLTVEGGLSVERVYCGSQCVLEDQTAREECATNCMTTSCIAIGVLLSIVAAALLLLIVQIVLPSLPCCE